MVLKFNGVNMPIPKHSGFNISYNKIWSKNTGRNDNGDMVGTIISIKRKIEIEWAVLTPIQTELINSVVSNPNLPFTTIEYTDETGKTTKINAYFGDITYPVYSMNANGRQIITGTKISGIEK